MKDRKKYPLNILNDDKLVIDSKFKNKLKVKLFERENVIMAKMPIQLNTKQLFNQRTFRFAGVAALLLFSTTAIYAANSRSQSMERQSIIEDVVELPQNLDGLKTLDEMRTLAQKDAPEGASIIKVEVENEHGAVLYKVKFSDGSYRLYDAITGLSYVDSSSGLESDESVPAGFVAGITIQQARDIAASQRPGKVITKIELEVEEGKVVYSVRFSDNGRVDIDATNGDVVRVKSEESRDTENNSDDNNSGNSNEDSDDSADSEDHQEEDTEDDGDKSGSDNSGSDNDNNSNDN
ncbi:PepSY domain-containing protein [Candidatus Saccharibacteria bacterium]|nr:PepSY domain-containing protein [Candidatus Saccharibacteria bacterium]